MHKNIYKPPEIIQAQIATFAAETIKDCSDRTHIFNNIGMLALGHLCDVVRETESLEWRICESGDCIILPKGTQITVATADGYLAYLRSIGGSKHEAIQDRANILKAYTQFSTQIEKLKADINDSTTRKEHPAFLGSGSISSVYLLESKGINYAARIPKDGSINPRTIDDHIGGAILGRGVPHLEQIIAASYEEGVTIAEIMPGKEIGELTIDDIHQITNAQLAELVDTLIAVNERGITIDPNPSNILYDLNAGFGIVDYFSSKVASRSFATQYLGMITGWIADDILKVGVWNKRHVESVDDYARELDIRNADLEILERYRLVVEEKLRGKDLEFAIKQIDLQSTYGQIKKERTNRELLNKQVALDRKQRQDAEYAKIQKTITNNKDANNWV
jgi:hypothetical protein